MDRIALAFCKNRYRFSMGKYPQSSGISHVQSALYSAKRCISKTIMILPAAAGLWLGAADVARADTSGLELTIGVPQNSTGAARSTAY